MFMVKEFIINFNSNLLNYFIVLLMNFINLIIKFIYPKMCYFIFLFKEKLYYQLFNCLTYIHYYKYFILIILPQVRLFIIIIIILEYFNAYYDNFIMEYYSFQRLLNPIIDFQIFNNDWGNFNFIIKFIRFVIEMIISIKILTFKAFIKYYCQDQKADLKADFSLFLILLTTF